MNAISSILFPGPFLSLYPPRYDMDQLLIPIFFFFLQDQSTVVLTTTYSIDAFFRYRISTHIKTIAYFPLQRWLNLPAFPTNERTNELRVPMQGILKSRARFSNSQGRERVYFMPNGWRSASDHRNRALNRSATSLKILVENRINVRVG